MSASAEAFAPAAISNFFTIGDAAIEELTTESDLHQVGAKGGGFVLSKGVRTRVTAERSGSGPAKISRISVDGNSRYEAKTTRTAAELLLAAHAVSGYSIGVDQRMEVPVGQGFGASAASALSTVNALASVLRLSDTPAQIAYFAHAADILCRTGLGTVSVTYRYGGAGVIVKSGAPGIAEVKEVRVPAETRIITASLAPFKKSTILSSGEARARVNGLGEKALEEAADLKLRSLVRAGENFARNLGLESPDVVRLIALAQSHGALGASQNMVGHAVHAVASGSEARRIAEAFRSDPSNPVVSVYSLVAGPSVA